MFGSWLCLIMRPALAESMPAAIDVESTSYTRLSSERVRLWDAVRDDMRRNGPTSITDGRTFKNMSLAATRSPIMATPRGLL